MPDLSTVNILKKVALQFILKPRVEFSCGFGISSSRLELALALLLTPPLLWLKAPGAKNPGDF